MIVRLSKVLLVLLIGLYALIVGADNIVDYGVNFAFVQHVMAMDTIFPDNTLTWRAVTSPPLHHAAYGLIIASELLTALLCIAGAVRLWIARNASGKQFQWAKQLGIAGLVCGFGLWFFGFLTIGAEWFQMWQSEDWNGQQPAFRTVACIGLVLIFLNQRDDELEKA
jgi:predicted small integral membrane protein